MINRILYIIFFFVKKLRLKNTLYIKKIIKYKIVYFFLTKILVTLEKGMIHIMYDRLEIDKWYNNQYSEPFCI